MSKEKVERYKQEKANRKQTLAKEKMKRKATQACAWAVLALIVGWAGYSGYQYYDAKQPAKTIYCQTTEIDNYMDSLAE